jgi:hypothetical protein
MKNSGLFPMFKGGAVGYGTSCGIFVDVSIVASQKRHRG